MKRLAVGLASGIGDAVYMLPAIKALWLLGHDVALYLQGDYPSIELWRRCRYAAGGVHDAASMEVDGREMIGGQWVPAAWKGARLKHRFILLRPHDCMYESNMKLAKAYGWAEDPPDVSDWCGDLAQAEKRFDLGFVPGCKGGIWLRKRWPGMNQVAEHFLEAGKRIAVFGLEGDDVDQVPGEKIDSRNKLGQLPDLLAQCRVIVSIDGGVGHLASSLGLPVVMIYTATSEVKARPVCKPHIRIFPENLPCHPCVSKAQWHVCTDWKCRNIDPARVIKAAEQLLGERP